MNKTIKKLLSVILIAAMAVGVLCIPASAEGNTSEFTSIFAIGDSNTMGYGLDGYLGTYSIWQNFENKAYLHGANGSYTQVLAEMLGIDTEGGETDAAIVSKVNRTCMGYAGFRAKDAYFVLGGNVADIDKDATITYLTPAVYDAAEETSIPTDNYEKYIEIVTGAPAKMREIEDKDNYFIKQLKPDAKEGKELIVLEVGASDVFIPLMSGAIAEVFKDVDTNNIMSIVEALIKFMYDNYKSFSIYVPKLIKRIKELAGTNHVDYELVVCGTFNPFKDLKISDDDVLPLLEAIGSITTMMNQQLKLYAKMYGATYVDISNVETRTLDNDVTIMGLLGLDGEGEYDDFQDIFHVSEEGYKYVARQVYDAVAAEKTNYPFGINPNMVIDLGSFTDPKLVTLNGNAVMIKNYNAETHKLTIPLSINFKGLNFLTVSGAKKNDDGEKTGTYLVTYLVIWNGRGYSAHRLFTTNSVENDAVNIAKSAVNTVKSIFSNIKVGN